MGQALCGGGRSSAITLADFGQPLGSLTNVIGASEATVARTIRTAGTFSSYGASFDANGTGRSIRWRKNSANANGVVSPADSTAQVVYDNIDADHYVATDTFDYQANGVAPAFTPFFIKQVFLADVGHVNFFQTDMSSVGSVSNSFSSIQGETFTTTEANAQSLMRTSGSLQNLWVVVTTASTSNATVISRIGGVNGTLTVSIPLNTTGIFEDTTHSDSFSSGSLVNWQVSGQSTGLVVGIGCAASYSGTTNEVFSGVGLLSISFNASDLFFPIVTGAALNTNTTESNSQLQHGFGVTTSRLRTFVTANAMTGVTTFRTRKNGADGNQVLTIGASTTGSFEDTTNNDVFTATDTIDYVQRGGTSGSITYGWWGITEASSSGQYLPIMGCGS